MELRDDFIKALLFTKQSLFYIFNWDKNFVCEAYRSPADPNC